MKLSAWRLSVLSLTVLVAACSAPQSTISLIPDKTADITSKEGVFTQPLVFKKSKPDCKGQCPTLEVKSLIFPGNRALTQFVDQQLAEMTAFDGTYAPSPSIDAFMQTYWKQAGPRDEVILAASAKYRNKAITVLELGAWQYLTGAAHGMGEARFINWDNSENQPLSFEQIIPTKNVGAFVHELQMAHEAWLNEQEAAQEDRSAYLRLWPFHPSDNIALTDAGIVVKYNSYEIAPYSSGQPEILIPYPRLKGIIAPRFSPTQALNNPHDSGLFSMVGGQSTYYF